MKKNASPLARARLSAGYTQEKAAKAIGCSTLHLLRVERGTETLSERLRQAMGPLYKIPQSEVARLHQLARRAWIKELQSNRGA